MLPQTGCHPQPATAEIAALAKSRNLHSSSKSSATVRSLPRTFAIPLEDLACAALFALFAMQGSIPGIAPPQALEVTASVPGSLTTWGGILSQALANALIAVLLLRSPRLLLRGIASVPWLALLAALAIASTAWSLDPALTLRRSVPFALAGLFGLWFAARFSQPRQLAILRLALVALALATIAMVVFAPSIALDHSSGHAADWQGVFTQKNSCGRIMVLAIAVLLFGERLTRAPGRSSCRGGFTRAPGRSSCRGGLTAARSLSLVICVFVLVMSGSRSAWLIAIALVLLRLALELAHRAGPRARNALVVAAPLLILACACSAVLLFPWIALRLGRDPTLSGRTAVWSQVLHAIANRPLLGYGYDAFWRGMTGPSLQIDAALHFVVEHAHNGFLEILLELGAAGLALFVLSLLRAARRLGPLLLRGDLRRIAFPLAVLVLILLCNLDENTLLLFNGIFWPLCVAALAQIEQLAQPGPAPQTRDRRHVAAPPPHDNLNSRRALAPHRGAALRSSS